MFLKPAGTAEHGAIFSPGKQGKHSLLSTCKENVKQQTKLHFSIIPWSNCDTHAPVVGRFSGRRGCSDQSVAVQPHVWSDTSSQV